MTYLLERFGVAVILAVCATSLGCSSGEHKVKDASDMKGGSDHAEVGKPAPDLSIQTLNGKGKVSIDGSAGKILIIDFWATWCGPCKESFPKLEALSKKLGDNVQIVGVSVDDEKAGVLEFAKENGATFAIGWDEGHKLAAAWKVDKMPTTFIVDGAGKVRYIHDGYHDGETDKMAKEVASIESEGPSKGDTRVAKNDTKDDKVDSKPEKSDSSSSSKSDSKSDKSEKDGAVAQADTADEEAPPPKKKPKGKGKSSGKATAKKKKK